MTCPPSTEAHLEAIHTARHLVLRRGDAVTRWHRIDREFSEAAAALDDARISGADDTELDDLKLAVVIQLQRHMDATRAFWDLDRQLDQALADALTARIDWVEVTP